MWGLVVLNLVRGADYVTGERDLGGLSSVESAFAIEWWGAIFLLASVVMAYGLATKNFQPLVTSGTISAAAYATLAVGTVVGVAREGWPPDDFRGVAVYLFFALISACYAYGAYLKRYAWRAENTDDERE